MTAVVYIAGAGRSGSTLLERLLSTADGVAGAGELRWLWTRGFAENHLCSCGARFRECPFWVRVVEDAFGSAGTVDSDAMQIAAREVDRLRFIPLHAWPTLASSRFVARREAYGQVLHRVYSAIGTAADAQIIVDSSKEPAYAFLLRRVQDVEVFVVHLVRDSRAVAFSWQRVRRRPEITWEDRYMPRYGVRKTSRDWMEKNALFELYRQAGGNTLRVRYEDLVASPQATVNHVLDRVERALGLQRIGRFGDGDDQQHTLSGNPVRFEKVVPVVRADDEWRYAMSMADRAQVSLLTAPLLARYGYRLAGW